jgi:hypothetical protein
MDRPSRASAHVDVTRHDVAWAVDHHPSCGDALADDHPMLAGAARRD